MVVSVRIKGWMGGSAEIRMFFGFVNPYELLDDPLAEIWERETVV